MSLWTWVLIGLCVAGALLALGSLVAVAVAALRLRRKLNALQQNQLFVSLQSLEMQTGRLNNVRNQAQPLVERSQAALASMRESVQTSGLVESRLALEQTGTELKALSEDLF